MNLDYLKLFVLVAAKNNISNAGEALNLSPAVASSHLSKLEASLGVRLFHRSTRKVSLTEDGEAFLPHAEDVIASFDAAKASVGASHSVPSGTLRVAAPASFGRMHIIPALNAFFKAYPGINITLKLSDNVVDLVEGGFDIAIRNSALKDSSLVARKLASDKRILCASPSYLSEFGSPQSPADLHQHHCITLSGIENWTFQTSKGLQTIKIKGRLKIDNGEAVRDACINGIGITVNSVWSAYKQIESGALVEVLKGHPLESKTDIWAVYPSSRQLAPKVRAFIDFISNYFGETPYWEANTHLKKG